MILSAPLITTFQSCARRHLLSLDWQWPLWRPRALFDHCLRRAWHALCRNASLDYASRDAYSRYMELAADPGLDIHDKTNTYRLARDHATMLLTTLDWLARMPRLVLRPVPDAPLGLALGPHTWRFSSWQDDSGALHRLVTADAWDADACSRELHSWYTMGDIAVARVPMTIHVLDIGQIRDGRRASPWVRAYRHSAAPNLPYRFRRTHPSEYQNDRHTKRPEFAAAWKPVWLSDATRPDAHAWVDRMIGEGVAQEASHTADVRYPSEAVCEDTRRQLQRIGEQMATAGGDWQDAPMSRGACDAVVPCPMQGMCYLPQTPPEKMGYRRVTASASKPAPTSPTLDSLAPAPPPSPIAAPTWDRS